MPRVRRGNSPISRSAYYRKMRRLALQQRAEYDVETKSLNISFIRRIYKTEGIKIDLWDIKGRKIRAAYFCDGDDFSVLVNRNLTREPKLFSLAHELKHHYVDQEIIKNGQIRCGDYNANEVIEIGGEVFAAEFIYPEEEMRELIDQMNITVTNCTPEKVVDFKRTCLAIVSYQFLVKRFEWFRLCKAGEYKKVKFQKLEESIFGTPIYKQEWFKQRRARKKSLKMRR